MWNGQCNVEAEVDARGKKKNLKLDEKNVGIVSDGEKKKKWRLMIILSFWPSKRLSVSH